jgi:hypothetical protein
MAEETTERVADEIPILIAALIDRKIAPVWERVQDLELTVTKLRAEIEELKRRA